MESDLIKLPAPIFGLHGVPGNEIHIIEFGGNRPSPSKIKTGLGDIISSPARILTPGFKIIILPFTTLEGVYSTNQTPVHLFRHDTENSRDYAELELDDITLKAKVTVVVRLSGGSIEEQAKSAYKAHYNSQKSDKTNIPDPLMTVEIILNQYVKMILQRHSFEQYESQKVNDISVDEIQISKISPSQILYSLGLKQSGNYIISDDDPDNSNLDDGITILSKLDNIGMEIVSINIDDLALPPEVDAERNKSALAKATQKARLDEEIAKAEVIKKQNENLNEELVGFVKAIKVAAEQSGKITEQQLWDKLVKYPTLRDALGDKAKVIFRDGATKDDILNQMSSALESSKD
jgi:hypothetical protein